MANPPSHHTYIPLSGDPEANDTLAPIHIVTHASQLPTEFVDPSPEKPLVVGFDCEGVHLGRHGRLCVMQLAFRDAVYLVDVVEGGDELMRACKPGLESNYVSKVIHDCKRDSEALFYQYDIKLNPVMDTQIAYALIEEQEGQRKLISDDISFVGLLADPRYCGVSYEGKEEVRNLLKEDPQFWRHRPLTELKVRAAADDVRFFHYIHSKMMEKLNEKARWHLAVHGALHSRCFCLSINNHADWPALPPVPGDQEEVILIVLDVPFGQMGRVIGLKGETILSVKASCNAEILIGGTHGPENKVFIIGLAREARKAEAILRGRMFDG